MISKDRLKTLKIISKMLSSQDRFALVQAFDEFEELLQLTRIETAEWVLVECKINLGKNDIIAMFEKMRLDLAYKLVIK